MRFPRWARVLVVLRNVLTAPLGLSANGPEAPDKLGVFPVEAETDDEIIAGFNDRHLNFRVSVLSRGGRVTLSHGCGPIIARGACTSQRSCRFTWQSPATPSGELHEWRVLTGMNTPIAIQRRSEEVAGHGETEFPTRVSQLCVV